MDFHRQIALALCLFFMAAKVYPEPAGISAHIDNFLASYAATMTANGYRVEYEPGNIDPRLRHKECANKMELKFKRDPLKQAQTTIELNCTDAQPWKLYIASEIRIYGQAISASSPIARGAVITETDISLAETQVNSGRADIITRHDHVIGMIARRSIPAGQHLTSRVLKAPELVDRGDQVTIIAQGNAVAIKTQGTALSSGSLGQQISVRNNRSERVIRARVIDRGQVAITL